MIARIFTICIASAVLTACGSASKLEDESRTRPSDPPAVAEKLSLGGQAQTTPAGSYEGAVNCVVALRVTAQRLQGMSTDKLSKEMRLIARAEGDFRGRALAAGSASERQIATDIERGIQKHSADAVGQAQLAISCLRMLETNSR